MEYEQLVKPFIGGLVSLSGISDRREVMLIMLLSEVSNFGWHVASFSSPFSLFIEKDYLYVNSIQ